MILNINIFKAGQYICYAGLFTFVFFLLDNNPLNNIFFLFNDIMYDRY